MVPRFDDHAVLNARDADASKLNAASRGFEAETVASVNTRDVTAHGNAVAFGNAVFNGNAKVGKSVAESAKERFETRGTFERLTGSVGQSVGDSVGRHHFVDGLLAAFVP